MMRKPIPLSRNSLPILPAKIATPRFAQGSVTPGIVHFGVGNFHRSHMAAYINDLMNLGEGLDWGIIGAGVTSHDDAMRRRLEPHDYLTTIVEQDASMERVTVSGAMVDFIRPEDREGLLAMLADPRIRIVSLTITEGGYFIDSATGKLLTDHPDICRDAADLSQAKTVFGLIVAALAESRAKGLAPFTVMSCDNLPHNGDMTRNVVTGLARLADPALSDWIAEHVSFPNSMVDRITPAATDKQRDWLAEHYGLADAAPVFCEAFRQWVLEDAFTAGRPALEKVGVTFVDEVAPYELMKIRILNGGHAVIAYAAGLMGIEYVHEAMEHPLIAAFLDKITREEIIPQVPPVPGVTLVDYSAEVARRFANPKVGDTIRRLCLDGSNRQPKFIVPTAADAARTGGRLQGLAMVSAMWRRYCLGMTDDGAPIAPNDPNWDHLNATAAQAPDEWLAMADIYGALGANPVFAEAFVTADASLKAKGAAATIRDWVGDSR